MASESKASGPVPDVCGNIHGAGGVYNAGEWVPIEDCATKIVADPSGRNYACGDCAACPNRRDGCSGDDGRATTGDADDADHDSNVFDVVVIGAGCIGGGVARELSKYNLRVLLVEKADDVTQGATKGNSGIVHAGYDDTPGSVRAKFCWPGNRMFAKLDEELRFGFIRNGSLVVAVEEEQMAILEELMERARKNGVENCRIIGAEELRRLEPNVSANAIAALHSPDAGTVTPYEFTIALVENAVSNGVKLRINTEVVAIEGTAGDMTVHTRKVVTPKEGGVALVPKPREASQGLSGWQAVAAAALAFACGAFVPSMRATAPKLLARIPALHAVARPLAAALGVELAAGAMLALAAGLGLLAVVVKVLFTKTAAAPLPNFAQQLAAQRSHAEDAAARGKAGATTAIKTKYVVNAAGLFSDKIANMVGDTSFTIKPRLGEYLLLHKNQGKIIKHVIFPAPGKMGKGVVVQPTLWGNLLLGPLARELDDPATAATTKDELMRELIQKCKKTFPHFDAGDVIHSFTGARAKNSRGDWIIETCAANAGMVHAAGIDSPGLAGSPAISAEVCRLLKVGGLDMVPNPQFNPYRRPIVRAKHANKWKGLSLKSTDPEKRVVCKCEIVTEAEIVDAIHRPTPCTSTQAVRKRTRAGMGHCQGQYCEPRVTAILARELGVPESQVRTRPWPESSLLPERWIDDRYKDHLRAVAAEVGAT